jgi:peptidoglycan hydrolase CwlO-like protein
MDDTSKILIGAIVSVAIVVITQFIMAARSTREKLEASNNLLILKEIAGLKTEIMARLDSLAEGQATMKKRQDDIEAQLKTRTEESHKKEERIKELERNNQDLHKRLEKLSDGFEDFKRSIQMDELKAIHITRNEKF